MNRDEIIREMERINALLGQLHNATNDIADREVGRALLGMPTDQDLIRQKESYVELSEKVVKQLQALHDELVGKSLKKPQANA